GERTVIWNHDRALDLKPEEIHPDEVTCARVLHVDGTGLAAAVSAARCAKEAGVAVSVDLDHPSDGVNDLLELTDFCVVGEEFPPALTGENDLEKALRALARKTRGFVCVTLGAKGCVALVEGELIWSGGFVVDAVDTTSCGDVFHAAFLVGA